MLYVSFDVCTVLFPNSLLLVAECIRNNYVCQLLCMMYVVGASSTLEKPSLLNTSQLGTALQEL